MKELQIENIRAETDTGWLIDLEIESIGARRDWFPKSQCTLKDNILTVPQWLYDKKFDILIKISKL